MSNLLLFVSLVLHTTVLVSGYFALRGDTQAYFGAAEKIVYGCVWFSAVAVLLGMFK